MQTYQTKEGFVLIAVKTTIKVPVTLTVTLLRNASKGLAADNASAA